ncbi:uncharacterized protein LOC113369573 [Ctenocephalides felis]|uniref:uncharacterized protein LOC113369573 n=1 Tax=Ctenocephalides felis TaxID=7515 RepID=UPI000E6E3A5D|nr:uncharacterized protein LOC113369573 [Ctenocephalides felis]
MSNITFARNCTATCGQIVFCSVGQKYTKEAEANSALESNSGSSTNATDKTKFIVSQESIDKLSIAFGKLCYEIKKIKEEQQEMLLYVRAHKQDYSATSNNPITISFKLPMASLTDVQEMEMQLNNDDVAVELIGQLSFLGGHNMRGAVATIMKKLFSRAVAVQYSSKGRKNKLDFSALKLCSVVIQAVRIKYPEVVDADIMKTISAVLAQSRDWDGAKKFRLLQKDLSSGNA